MNQTNQLGEMQHKCIWSKKMSKIQRFVLNGFSEGKNYNPMKHYTSHNQIENNSEIYFFKVVDYI